MRLVPRRGASRRKSRRPGAVIEVVDVHVRRGAPFWRGCAGSGDAWGVSQLSARLDGCTSGA